MNVSKAFLDRDHQDKSIRCVETDADVRADGWQPIDDGEPDFVISVQTEFGFLYHFFTVFFLMAVMRLRPVASERIECFDRMM